MSSNYRAAGRARSHKEFTAKVGVVREEADEVLHWLELLRDCALAEGAELVVLASEAEELVKIFVRSYETAKRKERGGRSRRSGDRAIERSSDRAIERSSDRVIE